MKGSSTGQYLSRTLTTLYYLGFLLRCASKKVKGRTQHHKDYFYSLPSISCKMNPHNTKFPQTKTVVLLSPSHSATLLPYMKPFLTFCLYDVFFSIIIIIFTVNGNVSVYCFVP